MDVRARRRQGAEAFRNGLLWTLAHGFPRVLFAVGARRGDPQAQLATQTRTGPELVRLLDRIRAAGLLSRSGLGLVTVDHATAKAVLAHPGFRSGPPMPEGRVAGVIQWASPDTLHPLVPPSLLVVEPPQHTRYRKLVTRVFTHRAVEALRDKTQAVADGLLDELEARPAGTPVDLARDYCAQLPVTVICEILGVPAADRARVLTLGAGIAGSIDLGVTWSEFRTVERSLAEFDAWLGSHIARLRDDPGEDLLSQLVHAEEDGVRLTDKELLSTAGLLLAAGFETTVNLLGNAVALLDEHPDQLALLRDRPELWPNAVEEALRIDPPVLLTGRSATADTTIAGTPLAEGTFVSMVIAGTNRDPSVFPDPNRFDVTRANARDHLSFGHGRHHCLGASLARMEGEVGLRSLYDRFPDLQVLPGARRRPTRILRGYVELPVRLR